MFADGLAGYELGSYAVNHAHQVPQALIFVGGNFRDYRVDHENNENYPPYDMQANNM